MPSRAEPGRAVEGLWRGPKGRVKEVAVIAGEWEILRDDITSFGQQLREEAGIGDDAVLVRVEGVEGVKKAVHVEAALDLAIGIEGGAMMSLLTELGEVVRVRAM